MKRMSFLAALLICVCALALVAGAGGYKILKKIPVAVDGGWDYLIVDENARRLYIAHSTQIDVLNVDTGGMVGKVADIKGAHGIALATEFNHGFATSGQDGTVVMFDMKTLASLSRITAGTGPDAIIYDPFTKRVFCENHRGGTVTVISAADGKVEANIEVGGALEFAASDLKGHVYVAIEDKNQLASIDAKKMTLEAKWDTPGCDGPSSLVMDRKTRRVLLGCHEPAVMAAVDADSGKVVATVPIGNGVDAAGFDPASSTVFESTGDGKLTVIHEDSADKYTVVETVETQRGGKTMALDPKTKKVYIPVVEYEAPAAPAADGKQARPRAKPGSFTVLEVGR